jgi:hypothetical protein
VVIHEDGQIVRVVGDNLPMAQITYTSSKWRTDHNHDRLTGVANVEFEGQAVTIDLIVTRSSLGPPDEDVIRRTIERRLAGSIDNYAPILPQLRAREPFVIDRFID